MTQIDTINARAAPRDLDRLITKAAAAMLLSVSTRTLDRLCSRDLIEKLHVGGSVRFRLSDVLNIIQHGL